MNRDQYEFSNMFWEDSEWELKIPKRYFTDKDGNFKFEFLSKNELREFLKIKLKENPKLLNKLRYKKIIRILN